MSNEDRRAASRSKAQLQFAAAQTRDAAIKSEIEKERAAVAAKTARLRALRLAKEEEDRIEAARLAAENPPTAKAKSSRKKVKSA